MDKARALVKELTGLATSTKCSFAGRRQYPLLQVPMNLLKPEARPLYVNTGEWASRAIKEAKMWGSTHVIASSEDKNFNYIPKGYSIPTDIDYPHITSNNTIFGTQFHAFPEFGGITVCDMSSDIFSRRTDFSRFDLIYAGAQKNMGPAGTTLRSS